VVVPAVVPLVVPAVVPLVVPAVVPLVVPAVVPLVVPAVVPLVVPAVVPLVVPAVVPLVVPVVVPGVVPVVVPGVVPVVVPVVVPGVVPVVVPVIATAAVPVVVPGVVPVDVPVIAPAAVPVVVPAEVPLLVPVIAPAAVPVVVAALCMLVGYRSRLANIVVWAMVLSIQWRNPFLLHGADELLRVVLFWGMFLPLGARWSVDRSRQIVPARISNRFVSIGLAGLFLQIAFMYWFAIILKSGREWRIDGTALAYALSSDELVSPIGTYLLHFPELLKVLTFATLGIEAFAPVLILSPFFKGPLRTLGVALVMSLHIGILIAMDIGYFPLLSAFCMVCYLPSWFWDTALPWLRTTIPVPLRSEHLASLVLSLPNRLRVDAAWEHLAAGRHAVLSLFTTGGAELSPSSVGTRHVPRQADVSEHVSAGKKGGTFILRSSVFSNVLAAFFLIYVFIMNVTTVSSYTMPLPSYSLPMAVALGLDQRWAMYSPAPAPYSYWFTIPGVLRDGQQMNLLDATITQDPDRAGAVSWDKPANVNATFHDVYWLRYLTTLTMPSAQERLLNFGGYVCRSWNKWYPDGPMQLQTFNIVYFTQPTLPEGKRGEIGYQVIWQHQCR